MGKKAYYDINETPMKWFWFVTHVQLPLAGIMTFISMVSSIGGLFSGAEIHILDVVFPIVYFVSALLSLVGLNDCKKYGLISYFVFLTTPLLYYTGIVIAYLGVDMDTSQVASQAFGSFVLLILNGIYFGKRRYIFISPNPECVKKVTQNKGSSKKISAMKVLPVVAVGVTLVAMAETIGEELNVDVLLTAYFVFLALYVAIVVLVNRTKQNPVIVLILLLLVYFWYIMIGWELRYGGDEITNICDAVCMVIMLIPLISTLKPVVELCKKKWYSTNIYKEKCYKKIAQRKVWLDTGVISQEEFDRMKKELLRNMDYSSDSSREVEDGQEAIYEDEAPEDVVKNNVSCNEGIENEVTIKEDEVTCKYCGSRNSNLASFCSNCGNKLKSEEHAKNKSAYRWVGLGLGIIILIFAGVMIASLIEEGASVDIFKVSSNNPLDIYGLSSENNIIGKPIHEVLKRYEEGKDFTVETNSQYTAFTFSVRDEFYMMSDVRLIIYTDGTNVVSFAYEFDILKDSYYKQSVQLLRIKADLEEYYAGTPVYSYAKGTSNAIIIDEKQYDELIKQKNGAFYYVDWKDNDVNITFYHSNAEKEDGNVCGVMFWH